MTERTYRGKTIEGWLSLSSDACYGKHIIEELAAHIRELEAELAEAKLQQLATASQAAELQADNAKLKESVGILDKEYGEKCEEYNNLEGELFKLKAERREFAHGCVRASRDAVTCRLIEARGRGENFWDAAFSVDMLAIVEQELAK